MRIPSLRFFKCDSGQALLEMALALPVLMTLVLNCVNMGYFFLVAMNVAASPRAGASHSIMGYLSPAAPDNVPAAYPASTPTSAANLTYEDLHGALASYASATVQVCSKNIGYVSGTTGTTSQKADCKTCTSPTDASCTGTNTYTPSSLNPDPEAPTFVMHRVDVTYTFKPLVSGSAFNIALLPSGLCSGGNCTFHRQISMRALD